MKIKEHSQTTFNDLYNLISKRDENKDEILNIIYNSEIIDHIKKEGQSNEIIIYEDAFHLDENGDIIINYYIPGVQESNEQFRLKKDCATLQEEIGKVLFNMKYKRGAK